MKQNPKKADFYDNGVFLLKETYRAFTIYRARERELDEAALVYRTSDQHYRCHPVVRALYLCGVAL